MIKLIIGLGNIGPDYQFTRHNCGFAVLNKVAATLGGKKSTDHALYDWSRTTHDGSDIILAWPKTLMNRSGETVAALVAAGGYDLEQILVVVDDFNLPLGRIRLRRAGSDGGHNGLNSIIETLGSEAFPRLRLGIGSVPESMQNIDFVLGRFDKDQLETAEKMFDIAAEAVIFAITNRFEETMTEYNN